MLDDTQRASLLEAFLRAFPNARALAGSVWIRTAMRLEDEVDLQGPRKIVFAEVLRIATDQGWLEALVRAALAEAPRAQPLQQAALGLGISPQPAVVSAPPAPVGAHSAELERLVRERAPPMLMRDFTARLAAASRAVCWVGLGGAHLSNDRAQFGTGVLVGSDLMLTNQHVIAEIQARSVEAASVCCQFDRLGDGQSSAEVRLAENWCLDSSPPAQSDAFLQGPPPTRDELDYALVRLERPVGTDPAADGSQRGWVEVAADPPPFEARDVILVVQHPAEIRDGQEGIQRITFGTVLGFEAEGLRLRHDANTTAGSSGSPAFTFDLRCAALHHAGRKDINLAIPLRPIFKRMRERGVAAFWS